MPSSKLKYPTKSHKGVAGRKPAALPSFWKRLRATEEEREWFAAYMTGDARKDFLLIKEGLEIRQEYIFGKDLLIPFKKRNK